MALHAARLLKILPFIPRAPLRKSTAEIHEYLEGFGYEVSRRQLERDLLQLQNVFPIACDDEKRRGWFWPKEAELPFAGIGLDSHTALLFKLAEQHLSYVLPKTTLRRLFRYFKESSKILERESKGTGLKWLERVRFLSPGVPIAPPEIHESIEEAVFNSLFEEKALKVNYRKRDTSSKEYVLFPCGLVVRQGVSYLFARYENAQDPHFFALHRMISATVLSDMNAKIDSADLDSALQAGAFGFQLGKAGLKVRLLFSREAGVHLLESKLSEDHVSFERENGAIEVTATLADNKETRWWLLGFGPGVEVLEPIALRDEVRSLLAESLSRYEK